MSDYIKSVLNNNPKFRQEVENIIETLKMSQRQDDDDLKEKVNDMIAEILDQLSFDSDLIDLSKISDEQKEALIDELSAIISDLVKHGNFASKTELIELVTMGIIHRFTEKSNSKNQEMEADFLSEEQKKKIEEEIKLAVIYETYQKLNPNRIAGETAMENVKNNLKVGGLERAKNNEGADLLGKLKPNEIKNIIKEGKNQGRGGSGGGIGI